MGQEKYVLSLLTTASGYLFAGMDYYGVYKSINKVVTNVEEYIPEIPEDFFLYSNYPNPFNSSTKIKYQIPFQSTVSLKVYDILGNEIATLVNEVEPAGKYEVGFTENNLPSGIYFYTLQAGNYTQTKKMILLK